MRRPTLRPSRSEDQKTVAVGAIPEGALYDSAWARLAQASLTPTGGRPEGEGWKTVREFADAHGIGRPRAQSKLFELAAAGLVEKQARKIGQQWTNFYRPVKSAKAK